MVAEATVLMFCGKFTGASSSPGGISSMEGKRRSFVASSVLSHLRTGGFSCFGLSADITMPSDSDLLTLVAAIGRMTPMLSDSISVSDMSDMLGEDSGDSMSRVSLLMAALFFLTSSAASAGTRGGGGETLLSEETLTCVDEGESSRFFASSFNTEAAIGFTGTDL